MLVETMSTAKRHRPSSEHHRSVVGREVGDGQEEPVPASRHLILSDNSAAAVSLVSF